MCSDEVVIVAGHVGDVGIDLTHEWLVHDVYEVEILGYCEQVVL